MSIQKHYAKAYGSIHAAADTLEKFSDATGHFQEFRPGILADVDRAIQSAREASCALSALRERLIGNPEPKRGD